MKTDRINLRRAKTVDTDAVKKPAMPTFRKLEESKPTPVVEPPTEPDAVPEEPEMPRLSTMMELGSIGDSLVRDALRNMPDIPTSRAVTGRTSAAAFPSIEHMDYSGLSIGVDIARETSRQVSVYMVEIPNGVDAATACLREAENLLHRGDHEMRVRDYLDRNRVLAGAYRLHLVGLSRNHPLYLAHSVALFTGAYEAALIAVNTDHVQERQRFSGNSLEVVIGFAMIYALGIR